MQILLTHFDSLLPLRIFSPRCRHVKDATAKPLAALRGDTFTKTWRIRNNDTKVAWPEGCFLIRIGGEAFNMVPRVQTGALAPGATVDINVKGEAPGKCGRYTSYWRMVFPDGVTRFGQRMWIDLHVTPSGGIT